MNHPKRSTKSTIRALKDPYFRRSAEAHAESVPFESHPAGLVALDDADLAHVSGAGTPTITVPITIASIRACAAAGAAVLASARTGCGERIAQAGRAIWKHRPKSRGRYRR
jgi:mersacidin/lichenicidin family type 2 lantibiotic